MADLVMQRSNDQDGVAEFLELVSSQDLRLESGGMEGADTLFSDHPHG